MSSAFRVTGANHLRAVARDLKAAGTPARGFRRTLRRDITAAVEPMKRSAQANVRGIPIKGPNKGLREAVANATKVRTNFTTRTVLVRLWVDPSKMPVGQGALPRLIEGERRWRHPVFGHTNTWVTQPSHPYFKPAVDAHLPGVEVAVMSAVNRTAAALERGTP